MLEVGGTAVCGVWQSNVLRQVLADTTTGHQLWQCGPGHSGRACALGPTSQQYTTTITHRNHSGEILQPPAAGISTLLHSASVLCFPISPLQLIRSL